MRESGLEFGRAGNVFRRSRQGLRFVQPRALLEWQKRRFRNHWRRKSQGARPGRPAIDPQVRALIRDRDGIYGPTFRRRVRSLGVEEVLTAPRSPRHNPYAERVIGTLRRECLDNVIVLHERHLRRVLRSYIDFYHRWRVHRSLEMDSPGHRPVQPPELGEVVEIPDVGGLQRHYERRAA